jgi:hypothetical protein
MWNADPLSHFLFFGKFYRSDFNLSNWTTRFYPTELTRTYPTRAILKNSKLCPYISLLIFYNLPIIFEIMCNDIAATIPSFKAKYEYYILVS